MKVYWTVQNADCSLTADYCFYGSKAMGLLLSCSHLHGENNGLQQSAVCTDWKVNMGYGMPKIAIEIMGLSTNLDWEDGIDENYWVTKTWRQAYNEVAGKGASWHLKSCCCGEG